MTRPISLKGNARTAAFGIVVFTLAVAVQPVFPALAQEGLVIPAPAIDLPAAATRNTAVFAGGCFWGVQGVFQHVKGVESATSGYAGGAAGTARYESVGSGTTGHAEAVRVVFDPKVITYGRLMQIYFSVAHDPTQLNRQGPDSGSQYRSAVFPVDGQQARAAKAYIDQLKEARVFDRAVVTKIEPSAKFYPAENYHQDFLTKNPDYPYIVINDMPKIENLKKLFPQDFRTKPVLVAQSAQSR